MTKKEKYDKVLAMVEAIVGDEKDMIANMANISAIISEVMGFDWTGFYIVKEGMLVLGPFQGHPACIRIKKGRGVCGGAWEQEKTLVVDNVEDFPGYIACSSATRSEIVVPVWRNKEIIAVLDIDSDDLSNFDETDAEYLEKVARVFEA